ncbi:hypothetical protein FHT76_008238 [Rhizobium sp. BK176]|nr:hypothetical protein [Rhizobium sp. BK181]MCS3744217.1 hypothetical protein [Rhizobium sp. BK661]MCS4096516.1 hypothetical protein [Rhizobium sp. BK176]
MRREGIDQPALFQRLDAVDKVGPETLASALVKGFGTPRLASAMPICLPGWRTCAGALSR